MDFGVLSLLAGQFQCPEHERNEFALRIRCRTGNNGEARVKQALTAFLHWFSEENLSGRAKVVVKC